MLDEIEDRLAGTPRFCELDKAWYGIQCCLCGGTWDEDNRLPSNIVFGGEFLLETDDVAITLKNHQEVAEIAAYLRQNDLQKIISSNFRNITD